MDLTAQINNIKAALLVATTGQEKFYLTKALSELLTPPDGFLISKQSIVESILLDAGFAANTTPRRVVNVIDDTTTFPAITAFKYKTTITTTLSAGTQNKIHFNQKVFDDLNSFTLYDAANLATSSRFTCTKAGNYLFDVQIGLDGKQSNWTRGFIKKNGVAVRNFSKRSSHGTWTSQGDAQTSHLEKMNVGDYIEIFYHPNHSGLTHLALDTHFSAIKIR